MVALKDPASRAILESADRALEQLCRWSVEVLGGSIQDAEELRLFTDGLALNAVCYPTRFQAEHQISCLNAFLDKIREDR